MTKPHAVLDACVLYPAPLRDFLMECAVADFYQPHWTEAIHEEWIRNLQANRPELPLERLLRTRDLMDRAVPQALVTGYEYAIETIALPDPGDRHVVAAALHSGASVIVTFNLRHFPVRSLAPLGIMAQPPDAFLMDVSTGQTRELLEMARLHRARLVNPPKDAASYIATLQQNHLIRLAELLALHIDEI